VPDEATALARLEYALRGLVAACHQARVGRLVYLSGVDLYAPHLPNRPIDEDFPTTPVTPAGRLRLAAETVLREAAGTSRLPLVILRPVTVFGPRDQTVTCPLLDRYACRPGPRLIGGGRARLSLVYVKDVARALALAARHPHAAGQTFHVSGCATTWRAFIATLCAELGVPSPRPGLPYPLAYVLGWWAECWTPPAKVPHRSRLMAAQVGQTRLYSDVHLARTLAYHPAYDLLAGVHETVAWYRGLARPARMAHRALPAAASGWGFGTGGSS
jgi:UDP-glucose 4-epimerase